MTANRIPSPDLCRIEEAVKQSLEVQIAFLRDGEIPDHTENMIKDLSGLNGAVKFSISRWIRDRVSAECRGTNVARSETADNNFLKTRITLADFYVLRNVLETLEDFPILADVLVLLSASDKKPLLEAIAETINHHVEMFQAIGAAEDLFLRLLSKTKDTYARIQSDRSILLSLIDIGENFPNRVGTVQRLRHEVSLCDPKAAIAACSPISDTMTDALQSSNLDFLEEMETMLSGGISLDKQNFSQIFTTISKRLRMAWVDDAPTVWSFIELLTHLRTFDVEGFDRLMFNWLQELVWLSARPPLIKIIHPLVCTRCLNMQTFIQHFTSNPNNEADEGDSEKLSLDILSLFDLRSAEVDGGRLRVRPLLVLF